MVWNDSVPPRGPYFPEHVGILVRARVAVGSGRDDDFDCVSLHTLGGKPREEPGQQLPLMGARPRVVVDDDHDAASLV